MSGYLDLVGPSPTIDGHCRDVVFESEDGTRYLVEVWNYGQVTLKIKPPNPDIGLSIWGAPVSKLSDSDEPERA